MPPSAAPAVELRAAGRRRVPRWMRALFRRNAPRARVIAPPRAQLGERVEVEWGVDCPAGNVLNVSVALVGSEIARQRISARTGISIVSHESVFARLEIARATPEPGLRAVYGHGSIVVPATTVPSVAGRRNEIAWAIVVEAELPPDGGATDLRDAFPIVVTVEPA